LPGAYHPTFLYEALWCLLVAAAVVLLDRRYRMDHGRSLALYVMLYTAGRFYIESLRIDEANIILGHRLNEWTSVLVFGSAAVGYLRTSRRNGWRGRSTSQDADGVPERQDI
jgi:prolipoprotein diacylglyceryltransferase